MKKETKGIRDRFDCTSPIDYRYWEEKIAEYLSERAFIYYKLMVEAALIRVLAKRGICDQSVVKEVEAACDKVKAEEVYEEEDRIRHDIRALVNCIQKNVGDKAKPFVHMTATSFDISDTANAARHRDVTQKVLLPALINLEKVLIEITEREAETLQIGRTHGQHAEPITFGFAMAEYVSRIGQCIVRINELSHELVGKFSGAVGAYNASALLFADPERFEEEVLVEIGLYPGDHSTQIVQPEPLNRLLSEIIRVFGVMANLADDMRNLQRTEIGEVGESVTVEQVGSSTMPQKRNPINFENIKSLWKQVMPRAITLSLDQISEHQRDLTNSASARCYGEIIAYIVSATDRLAKTMSKLSVDKENMLKNLNLTGDLVMAEPLYIIFAKLGHPDAHEKTKEMTRRAQELGVSLATVIESDEEIQPYLNRMAAMAADERYILAADPKMYTGVAAEKARRVASNWKKKMAALEKKLN